MTRSTARIKKDRQDWVCALQANPDRILHPTGFKPGEFSDDQYHLLLSATSGRASTSREDGADWRALIPDLANRWRALIATRRLPIGPLTSPHCARKMAARDRRPVRRPPAILRRMRATQDADEPLWSVERFPDFAKINSGDSAPL